MTRSELMSRIKSKGNASTELALARVFRRKGVTGWRRQQRVHGISIDFTFPKMKIAVFVDGCFWHACATHCDTTKLNTFWRFKVMRNAQRDMVQTILLKANGWNVIRVWEHSLKGATL